MAVLSLTWKSPYVDKTVFILRRGPATVLNRQWCNELTAYLSQNHTLQVASEEMQWRKSYSTN